MLPVVLLETTLPHAITDTQVTSYTYDPLGRLSGAAYSSGECFRYGYDRVGNRTAQTQTITSTLVTTYTYDVANRLTKVGGVTYTWDNNPTPLRCGDSLRSWQSEERRQQSVHVYAGQPADPQ